MYFLTGSSRERFHLVIMMCVNTALPLSLPLSTSAGSCNKSSIQCARLFITAAVHCWDELPFQFLCGGVVVSEPPGCNCYLKWCCIHFLLMIKDPFSCLFFCIERKRNRYSGRTSTVQGFVWECTGMFGSKSCFFFSSLPLYHWPSTPPTLHSAL